MKTLHLAIITTLAAVLLLHPSVTYAQNPPDLPHQIAPLPPNKIGCYVYTNKTGWQPTPCANSSQTGSLGSMGPLPTLNSTKRLDIHVGIRTGQIAVNPDTNIAYVTNIDENSVSVISGLTNKIVDTIPVGTSPVRLAVNPSTNMVYVSNANSQSVSVISGDTNSVVATIPVGSDPQSIAINHRTNMIYVANWISNTVSVIDGSANKVVATLSVCNLWSSDLAVDEPTDTIYVTCTGPEGKLVVISGTTNQLAGTISVGRDPDKVALNPNTGMLYTANNGDNTVSVVSAKENKLVDTISVAPFPNFVAVNPVTNTIYVTSDSYQNHKLSVISGETDKVVRTIDVDIGAQNIAIDSSDNVIYVPNYVAETLSVVSGKANSVIDTIPVGPNPSFIAINNATKTVYISNFGGTVSVIPFSNLDLQTVPEFSFAVPVLLVGIASGIMSYRMGIRK
ncbi:MAG: YncE family protein [Thaumarchaeota archaeon]|nr:YncE family protein [Nitrososphaerota archaeon]